MNTSPAGWTPQSLIGCLPEQLLISTELTGPAAQAWLQEAARLTLARPLAQLRGDADFTTQAARLLREADAGFNPVWSGDHERLRQNAGSYHSLTLMAACLDPELPPLHDHVKFGTPSSQAALACLEQLYPAPTRTRPAHTPENSVRPTSAQRSDWIDALAALLGTTPNQALLDIWSDLSAACTWSAQDTEQITRVIAMANLQLPAPLSALPAADWLLAAQRREAPEHVEFTPHELALRTGEQTVQAAHEQQVSELNPGRRALRSRLLCLRLQRHPEPEVRATAFGLLHAGDMGLNRNHLTPGSRPLPRPPVNAEHLLSSLGRLAQRAENSLIQSASRGGMTAHSLLSSLQTLTGHAPDEPAPQALMATLITTQACVQADQEPSLELLELAVGAWEAGLVIGLDAQITLPASLVSRAVNTWQGERLDAETDADD